MAHFTWTEQKDDFLAKYYQKLGAQKCADILGTTLSSVYMEMYTINTRKKPRQKMPADELRQFIKENAKTMADGQIAMIAGRSEKTVAGIRQKLGICHGNPNEIKIPGQDAEGIIHDYENGASISQLSKEYGYSRHQIRKLLPGKEKPAITQLPDAELEALICRDFQSGSSTKELTASYHKDSKTIKDILIRNGIQPRGRGGQPADIDIDEAIRLHNTGLSWREAAKQLGTNQPTLSRRLKNRNEGITYARTKTHMDKTERELPD